MYKGHSQLAWDSMCFGGKQKKKQKNCLLAWDLMCFDEKLKKTEKTAY